MVTLNSDFFRHVPWAPHCKPAREGKGEVGEEMKTDAKDLQQKTTTIVQFQIRKT